MPFSENQKREYSLHTWAVHTEDRHTHQFLAARLFARQEISDSEERSEIKYQGKPIKVWRTKFEDVELLLLGGGEFIFDAYHIPPTKDDWVKLHKGETARRSDPPPRPIEQTREALNRLAMARKNKKARPR